MKRLRDKFEYNVSLTPLGRLARPQNLIGTALFFAGDEGNFVTAMVLVVDGGRHMH